MSDEQVEHFWSAVAEFQKQGKAKYEAGVEEHGGNLWDHDELWLIEHAMEECIDQWMYLKTARDKNRARNRAIITIEGELANGTNTR
jgi:hypothetical protein